MKITTKILVKVKKLMAQAIIVSAIFCTSTSLATADFGSIEDRLMIQDIWARYVITLDSANADAYTALFTEDATLNINRRQIIKGRTAIRKMIETIALMPGMAAVSGSAYGPMRHIVTSLVLDINGDTATAESFWTEVMSAGKDAPPRIFNVGRYEDKFVKKNGKWYFS